MHNTFIVQLWHAGDMAGTSLGTKGVGGREEKAAAGWHMGERTCNMRDGSVQDIGQMTGSSGLEERSQRRKS